MAKPTKHETNSKEILKNIKELGKMSIRWGARGINNQIKIAANEFGTGTIPERPAFRMTFGSSSVQKQISRAAGFAIDQIIAGKDVEDSAKGIGEVGLAALRKTYRSNIPPPNAPSTIRKKGEGKNTLFDTGELFRELAFDVVK